MHKRLTAAALAAAALTLTACDALPDVTSSTAPSSMSATPAADGATPGTLDQENYTNAVQALPSLNVISDDEYEDLAKKAPKYDRSQYGPAWADVDHNGCDTRNDVLGSQLDNIEYTTKSKKCKVESGTYTEPYFGTQETFTKGEAISGQDEIDHIVPLKVAWVYGAHAWPGKDGQEERAAIANDPMNLVVTTRQVNSAGKDVDGDTYKDRKDLGEYPGKSDMGAADWLEWMHDDARKCNYASRYVLVTKKYDLPIVQSDKKAIEDAFAACKG